MCHNCDFKYFAANIAMLKENLLVKVLCNMKAMQMFKNAPG